MNTTYLAVLILLILDVGILLLLSAMDNWHMKPVVSSFFNNRDYDEPINRFILSKGGTILLSLVFLTVMILSQN